MCKKNTIKSKIIIVIGLFIFINFLTSANALPDHFDWKDNEGNWMTSVKDQGHCGSCWAYASVGTVEAQYNIGVDDPNYDLDLSEEYLVSDCYSTWDCDGGLRSGALNFIKNMGITDETCFPYADYNCYDDICGCAYGCSDATCSDRCAGWQAYQQHLLLVFIFLKYLG